MLGVGLLNRLVTERALRVCIVDVIRRSGLYLTRWVVAHETVLPADQFMWDLRGQPNQKGSGPGKANRRVADGALAY